MTEIRCKKCNALLLKAGGSINIEVKCRKCKYINKIKLDCEKERKMIENMLKESYTPIITARAVHESESFKVFPVDENKQ